MAISTISAPQAVTYPGAVLQVVQGVLSTSQTTSSTTYVTTNLTASITPKSATSKILILFTGSFYSVNTGPMYISIYRNSTNLEPTPSRGFLEINVPTAGSGYALAANYLDSPATTSSTSYSIYWRSSAGTTFYFSPDGAASTITLMEIAA